MEASFFNQFKNPRIREKGFNLKFYHKKLKVVFWEMYKYLIYFRIVIVTAFYSYYCFLHKTNRLQIDPLKLYHCYPILIKLAVVDLPN